mmetsp:Transcript_15285/g.39466  ORF Transcript_15285/g.39466 Transcript_15285/m.39466 type:complete len:347 (+) Transcript_15285:3-1043(+)
MLALPSPLSPRSRETTTSPRFRNSFASGSISGMQGAHRSKLSPRTPPGLQKYRREIQWVKRNDGYSSRSLRAHEPLWPGKTDVRWGKTLFPPFQLPLLFHDSENSEADCLTGWGRREEGQAEEDGHADKVLSPMGPASRRAIRADRAVAMTATIEESLLQGSQEFCDWMLTQTDHPLPPVSRELSNCKITRKSIWRQAAEVERLGTSPRPPALIARSERPPSRTRVVCAFGDGDRQARKAAQEKAEAEASREHRLIEEQGLHAQAKLNEARHQEASWWESYLQAKASTQEILAWRAAQKAKEEAEREEREREERLAKKHAELTNRAKAEENAERLQRRGDKFFYSR